MLYKEIFFHLSKAHNFIAQNTLALLKLSTKDNTGCSHDKKNASFSL